MEDVSYRSGARRVHRSTRDYLEYLDEKLGFSKGTLYNLCMAAVKSKEVTKGEVTVTYRGLTEGERRLTHGFVQVSKGVFLIEFKIKKAEKMVDRVVQVHLDLLQV